MAKVIRHLPNQDHDFAATGVTIAPCAPAARILLRGDPKDYEKTLGFPLPDRIGTSRSEKTRHALMLGPDEWLVYDAKSGSDLMSAPASKAFTAVDVSHRNTGWTVTGRLAALALATGCPRDLRDEAFPIGACARTIFAQAQIVLYRTGKQTWRVECWRSFSPYVFALLKEGARDAAL